MTKAKQTRCVPTFRWLDLPNELLPLILEHLPNNDLRTFLFCSRTSYMLWYRLYLERYGVRSTELLYFGTESADFELVDAIRSLPLELPTLTETVILSIKFVPEFEDRVRKMAQAVGKLSGLRFISVSPGLVDVGGRRFGYRSENIPTLKSRDTWTSAIRLLLDALPSTHCPNLCVDIDLQPIGGHVVDVAAELKLERPAQNSLAVSTAVCGVSKLSRSIILNRPLEVPHMNPNLSRFPSLRSFTLGSEIMLCHPLLDWTVTILNTSIIDDFSLALHPTAVNPGNLGLFLSQLTMPALSSLTISSAGIHLTHLIDFLSRHRISTLILGIGTVIDDSAVVPPFCITRLLEFAGSAKFLSWLLRGVNSMPILAELFLEHIHTSDFEDIYHILYLFGEDGSGDDDLSENTISQPITLKLHFASIGAFRTYLDQGWCKGGCSDSASCKLETRLRRVQHLKICTYGDCSMSAYDVQLLSRRVGLFPELKRLYFPRFPGISTWSTMLPPTVKLLLYNYGSLSCS